MSTCPSARRPSKRIFIGNVPVGDDAPVAVQSMTKTDTRDARATIRQINELEEYGCEIVRVAVPDAEAADAIAAIKRGIRLPVVADIHFDYQLALQALRSGADGLRLNPGNIADVAKVTAVVQAAKERRVPIRIGVNAGSLPATENDEQSTAQRMVAAALKQVRLLENLDFDLIKVSLKAFDVPTTIAAYSLIANQMPYPLHLGITEAGTPKSGVIRSSVGIGTLLYLGLGDTIRVSLTAHPREEVIAAYEILKSLNLRRRGAVLVSCPQCGRSEVNLIEMAEKVERALAKITTPLKVAVMGCVVNGPGEAKDADIGIAYGKGRGVLFKHGAQLGTYDSAELLPALLAAIKDMTT